MNDLKAQDSGMSTAQAGRPLDPREQVESILMARDNAPIISSMLTMDKRVYDAEIDLWRCNVKIAEDLYRSEAGKAERRAREVDDREYIIKNQNDMSNKVRIALDRAGIKLVPLRNNKGYRVVILKRKPKKK